VKDAGDRDREGTKNPLNDIDVLRLVFPPRQG